MDRPAVQVQDQDTDISELATAAQVPNGCSVQLHLSAAPVGRGADGVDAMA
jgi:hypothetical protein